MIECKGSPLFVLLVLMTPSPGVPAEVSPRLLSRIDAARPTQAQDALPPYVLSEEPVGVDASALAAPSMFVDLGGRSYLAQRTKLQATAYGAVWRGKLAGTDSTSTITVRNGMTAATLFTSDQVYLLRPGPAGRALLARYDPNRVPHADRAAEQIGLPAAAPRRLPAEVPTASVSVAVMELYSRDALQAAGGAARIEAMIQNAVDTTNTALADSGAGNVQVNLVFTGPADYTGSGSAQTDLGWLTQDPTVASLRTAHNADLVGLWARAANDAAGVAFRPVEFWGPPYGFHMVVLYGQLVYAHEVGHNLGCDHDPQDAFLPQAKDPEPWARGYIHDQQPQFRTIMAYPNPCPSCKLIPRYSSPLATYAGVPTGVADDEDNVRMILYGAPNVARYHQGLTSCVTGNANLCLDGGRFHVQADWTNQFNGASGSALAIQSSDSTGFFYFTDPSNYELIVKILNINGAIKVFYGELTDLHFTITINDVRGNTGNIYHNTPGDCGAIDEHAFSAAKRAPGAATTSGSCAPGSNALCLLGRRFAVSVTWMNQFNGASGQGSPQSLSDQSGLFSFTDAADVELVMKVVDFGDRTAFFWAALSDFEYDITVTDTVGGTTKTYHNPAGNYCGGLDNNAFPP